MLRICHPADFEGFFFYDKRIAKFAGPFASVYNEAVDLVDQGMKALMGNFSLVIEPSASLNVSVGNSENFQGCIPAIQNNQSDLLFALVEYPSHHSNVSQGLTVFETVLTIGSMYQKDTTGQVAQALDSFKSFSYGIWFLCVITFCCLSLLVKMRNGLVMKKRNHYNMLYTGTHMMRLNSLSDLGLTRRIIFLCASLYSLVVVHYFCSLIKTELVTTRDPVVFRSYQDIIDRGVVPVFIENMSYDAFFSSEEAPHYRRSLWKYASTHFKKEEIFVQMSPVQSMITALKILLEKSVIIVDSLVMPVVPASGCPVAARDPNKFIDACNHLGPLRLGSSTVDQRTLKNFQNLHLTKMPGFNFFTAVGANESHIPTLLYCSFHKTFRKIIEAGLHLQIAGRLKGFDATAQFGELTDILGPTNKSRLYLAQECESCVIIKPDSNFHPMTKDNFKTLLTIMIALQPVFLMVLLLE